MHIALKTKGKSKFDLLGWIHLHGSDITNSIIGKTRQPDVMYLARHQVWWMQAISFDISVQGCLVFKIME